MKAQIESLLFIAAKPLSVVQVAKAIGSDKEKVQADLDILMEEYNSQGRGIHIIKVEHSNTIKYQMVTNPEYEEIVNSFTKQEISGELTRPSLETLTIVAYRGPITKPELEKIRGVNCSLILRNLMIRGLVEEQKDSEKGEFSYMVTPEFIQWLGIASVTDLPSYENLHNDEQLQAILENKNEQE